MKEKDFRALPGETNLEQSNLHPISDKVIQLFVEDQLEFHHQERDLQLTCCERPSCCSQSGRKKETIVPALVIQEKRR